MINKIPDQQKVWDSVALSWKTFRTTPIKEAEDFLKNKKGNVLDLGCGSGRNFINSGNNLKWHGIDFSEEMLNYAKQYAEKINLDVELKQSNAEKIPYPNNFFDAVICIAVIHCIPSKQKRGKTLKEIYRILKPKSQALITVWDKDQQDFKNSEKEKLIDWKKDNKVFKRYYYLYEKEEFKNELEKSGFKIMEIYNKENPSGLYSKRNLIAIVEKS